MLRFALIGLWLSLMSLSPGAFHIPSFLLGGLCAVLSLELWRHGVRWLIQWLLRDGKDAAVTPAPAILNAAAFASPGDKQASSPYEFQFSLVNMQCDSCWCNLGYWKQTRESDEDASDSDRSRNGSVQLDYPAACRALAVLLGERAVLGPEDDVIDVGYGYGDQAFLWREQFGVRSVLGFNLSMTQVTVAQRRLLELKQRTHTAPHTRKHSVQQGYDRIDLRYGSGTQLHNLLPSPATGARNAGGQSFSKILCLDSAYHFDTRASFFVEAARLLRPGGVLALTDLILAGPASSGSPAAAGHGAVSMHTSMSTVSRLLLSLGCWLTAIPVANMVTWPQYRALLRAAGFDTVRCEFIEEDVFPGFSSFVTAQHGKFASVTAPLAWLKFLMTAKLLRVFHRNRTFRYVVVTAEKSLATSAAASALTP